MVKADEGLKVVDDAGGTGSRPLLLRLKVPKDLSVEGDSPGGGGGRGGREGSKTMTAEDLLPECMICGKRFQTVKAVHGHMRVHVQEQRESVEKESRELLPRRDLLPSTPSVDEKTSHEIRVCRKSLPSPKSLHGHMRLQPDRSWRGVHPLAEGLFPGWSITGKRGRQSSDSVSHGGGPDSASEEIGSSTREEADIIKDALRFMAMDDKEYLKLSLSLPDEKVSVSGESDETKKVEIKIPQDEKPSLDVPRIKADEAESKNSRMGLGNGKPNRAIKRKARETIWIDLVCAPANKYTCSRCHKSFSKYQSLGGHRSSCNKSEWSTTAYQAAQPWSKLPQLDLSLSLSPLNSSQSNLAEPEPQPQPELEPGGRKMGFDLNVSLEESDHMEENLNKFL